MLKRIIPMLLALFVLSACVPYMYGVPEEEWIRMSPEQRQVTMDAYNAQQKIEAAQRLEEAKRAAEEARLARLQAERDAQNRYHYNDTRYPPPPPGAYTRHEPTRPWRSRNMIRVTVEDGEMRFRGKHREYQPVTFTIAEGERRALIFRRTGRKSHHQIKVLVEYRDDDFYFDIGKRGIHSPNTQRVAYRSSRWKTGKKFRHISLGPGSVSNADNISISIKLLTDNYY